MYTVQSLPEDIVVLEIASEKERGRSVIHLLVLVHPPRCVSSYFRISEPAFLVLIFSYRVAM